MIKIMIYSDYISLEISNNNNIWKSFQQVAAVC